MSSSLSGRSDRLPARLRKRIARSPLIVPSGVYAALVLLHLLAAFQVRYPTIFHDDFVCLGFGRFFSGTFSLPNVLGGGYGHFGSALPTVPAFLLSSSFPDQFLLVLVINSLLISTC
jgi:hypothetical protein